MLGFYSVRKLIESKTLSDSIDKQSFVLLRFERRPDRWVTHLNWHRVDELYDLSASREVARDLPYVCNQFVHSYVFVLRFSKTGGFDNILLASDRERQEGVFFITASQVIDLFEAVGHDYPASARMLWDSELGDYRVTKS